jgi:hypothetical protein
MLGVGVRGRRHIPASGREKVLRTASARGATARTPSAAAVLAVWAIAIALFLVGAAVLVTPHERAAYWLRDLPVYRTAIATFAAGSDPYRAALAPRARGLFFTGPPFVWELYKLAAESSFRRLVGPALVVAGLVSSAVIPLVQGWLFLGRRAERMALGCAFFFAAFAGAGFFAAMATNNGTPLYALLTVALVPGVTRDRWFFFNAAVALATAFKPFYAAFWLVPLLSNGSLLGCLAAMAAAALTYLAPLLAAPALFHEWLRALSKQTLIDGLLGSGLFAAVFHQTSARLAPYEAQLAFSALLVIASLALPQTRTLRIAGLMLAAVFLNPRLMPYDICVAAIPLLACVAGAASGFSQATWAVLLVVVMIACDRNTPSLDGFLYPALAVLALFAAIASRRRPATV